MVVLCRDREKARGALETIRQWMGPAGLSLHPTKTRVVEMTEPGRRFDFLGYRFWRTRGAGIKRLVRPKSKKKLRAAIKPQTRRTNGESMEAIAQNLQPVLRGWYGYFKHAHADVLKEMDGWVRGRLRAILRQRRGGRGRGRGNNHHRWRNRYFDTRGFFSLEAAQARELTSLHQGAKC